MDSRPEALIATIPVSSVSIVSMAVLQQPLSKERRTLAIDTAQANVKDGQVTATTRYWRDGGELSRESDTGVARHGYILMIRENLAESTNVPSGCGFVVGAISLPSGATIRFRPPRR
jgi:hypothetical protein